VIRDKTEISAIGHRVVHGGETFHSPTIIDEKVIAAIKENMRLAPLHNPPNLMGIEVARSIFPDSPQVAVFDTAFHQTIPMKAFLYAIPYKLYEKNGIRRYGFHGTSHAYVAERAAAYLGRPLSELNLITVHLGNGASMAALKNGKCMDTTMGMTPLEGLVMGTRSGDVDPALPFFLADHLGMSLKDIDGLLNKDSGLKGMCGTNDMREVMEKKDAGDVRAKIALEVYTYRIKKYIGAYFAALESLDALIFTAGIGENSPYIRELCCSGLQKLGIEIDPEKNRNTGEGMREISTPGSEIKILVVPTNEELKIAQETKKVIESEMGV
jgi:acetate kinase